MYELGLLSDDFVEYISWLTENNYVHEGRFAEIYVRSKFNQKHWGRQKSILNYESEASRKHSSKKLGIRFKKRPIQNN